MVVEQQLGVPDFDGRLGLLQSDGQLAHGQIQLSNAKIESTVRCLDVDMEDALELTERTGV
ncbi:hypothetical protein [uncultured Sphingomonas sp.]|uniref:hypothetical protein n=1 Tax=uncultured Sphingomonas sp. TaxID=158754 RepID=UPI0035C9762C